MHLKTIQNMGLSNNKVAKKQTTPYDFHFSELSAHSVRPPTCITIRQLFNVQVSTWSWSITEGIHTYLRPLGSWFKLFLHIGHRTNDWGGQWKSNRSNKVRSPRSLEHTRATGLPNQHLLLRAFSFLGHTSPSTADQKPPKLQLENRPLVKILQSSPSEGPLRQMWNLISLPKERNFTNSWLICGWNSDQHTLFSHE